MPRGPRAVIPACPHHVTQRGNNRQDVFFVDADRQAYLAYLQDAAGRFALRVEGYCLMTNHIYANGPGSGGGAAPRPTAEQPTPRQ